MNVRERVLAVVVVVLLLGVGGNLVVKKLLLEPIAAKRSELAQAKQGNSLKRRQREQLRLAAKQLERWRRQSLPPNPDLAPSLYQAWLAKLAEQASFDQAKVSPKGRRTAGRNKEEVFLRHAFSIRGSTTLKGLVDFLHAFYRAPLLHQIQQINVSPATGQRAGKLDVTIAVEGLALIDAPPRDTLFVEQDGDAPKEQHKDENDQPQTQPGAVASARSATPDKPQSPAEKVLIETISRLASAQRDHYELIVDRNIFAPFQPPPPPAPDGVDEAEHYRLTFVFGVFDSGREEPEGVLYSALDDQYVSLRPGEDFEAADVRGRVLRVGVRDVELEIDQRRHRLSLGKNLRQLEAIAEVADPSAPPAGAASEEAQAGADAGAAEGS